MKLVQKLAGNTFYLFLDWIVITVLSFAFWVLVWKTLPPESAGIIATSLNMIILISTFGMFGLHATVTKLIAEYSSKQKIKSLIRFSTKILIMVNLAISVGFFLIISYMGVDLKLPFMALVLVSIGIFVWPLANLTSSVLYGSQNMKRIFKTDLTSNVLKLAIAAGLIFLGYETLGPIAAMIAAFGMLIVFRRDTLSLGDAVKELSNKREVIMKYAFPAFIASVAWALFINTPTIILTFFDSLESSGLFAASISLTNPLAFVPLLIGQAVFPIISSLMAKKNHAKTQSALISLVLRYIALVSVPLLIIYMFFAKSLVLVFAQLEYLDAVPLIPIVGVAVILQGVGHVMLQGLFAIRKTEANRNIMLLNAGVFLALAIPGTMMFGINGLLAAFVFSVFVFLGAGYFTLTRSLSIRLPWKSFGKIFASVIPLVGILLIGQSVIPTVPVMKTVTLFLLAIFGSYLYFKMLKITKFYTKDDRDIMKLAGSRIPFANKVIKVLTE